LKRAGWSVLAAVGVLGIGVLGGAVGACSDDGGSPAGGDRSAGGAYAGKSLLIVSIDTLRADRLGTYGYTRNTSPRIDALASEAVVFEEAYSSSPKTASSHMTLFTSLMPTVHGVQNIAPEKGGLMTVLAPNRRTLAEVLEKNGYWTAAVVNGGNLQPQMGFQRGFGNAWTTLVDDVERIVDGALKVVDLAPKDRPAFLFVHTYQVHGPYVPPQKYIDRFCPELRGTVGERVQALIGRSFKDLWRNERQDYWEGWEQFGPEDTACLSDLYDGEIAYTDRELGRLFKGLAKRGFLDDAIVVVLSDHGEEFAEHGRYDHNQLFREDLHVPLIVRLPDGRGAGSRVRGMAGLIDVMPTVLDLLGIAGPREMTGRSLASAIESGATDGRPIAAERVRWAGDYQASLRSSDWNLIFHAARGELDAYDIARDPGEQDVLGDDAPFFDAAKTELHRRLTEAFELREALDAKGKGGHHKADAETLEQLEGLGYTGEGGEGAVTIEGTPLERWPGADGRE
jgi:arylsulfatase A-like enzyme